MPGTDAYPATLATSGDGLGHQLPSDLWLVHDDVRLASSVSQELFRQCVSLSFAPWAVVTRTFSEARVLRS